ncbi:MAG: hypothetical protein QOG53_2420 [Frankiales bacterium]|jgi:hypothetical protein|nr:hypothetical protein [Frankiales bacterium]
MTTQVTAVDSGASKIGPIAGIVFVILFVLSFFLYHTPDSKASDAKWLSWWQDSGHRHQAFIASLAMALAAVAFLWLAGALRRRLGAALGADASYGGGVAVGVICLIAAVGAGSVAVAHDLADVPIPKDVDLLRYADGGYYGFIFLALPFAAAAFLIPLFSALGRSGVLPAWLRVAALVVGIICLSGPFLFIVPIVLFLLWVLIASIALLMRDGATPANG